MATQQKSSNQNMRTLPTWMLLGGMALVLLGERMIGAGTLRWISAVGAAMVLGSVVLRGLRLGGADSQRAVAERSLLLFAALGVVALVFYGLQSDLTASMFDRPIDRTSPKLAGMLTALWPVLVLAALLPTVFVEVAWSAVARAPKLEVARIRDASFTGLGLAGALTFAFSMVYVATQRDAKLDLSYFRTAKAGESTHKIVQALDQPLDVSIFYPPSSEVREEVESYFSDLAKDSQFLKVATYDNAVDISKAKELNVTANGMVVISRGGRKETLSVGLELEAARSQLRNLDKEVQKRLLQVARPGHTFYLTTGHGERAFDPANDTDKRGTLRDLREVLQSQSYSVRTLGVQDGLGVDVPNDATIVAIIGPQQEFLPEEVSSLERYLDRGGRVFIALDPDQRTDFAQPGAPPVLRELLAKLGLKYDLTPLANDQAFAQRTHQKPDRQNIVTAGYSSHPSVSTLSRMGGQAPLILVGAGHLEEVKERAPGTTVDFTVRAHPQTFSDANRDFTADQGEQRKTWELAAAVKRKLDLVKPEMAQKKDDAKKDDAKKDDAKKDDAKKSDVKKDDKKPGSDEMRAVVFADSDALSDGVLAAYGNRYLVFDAIRWLSGDESIAGEVSSETDVPIAHTRKQDQVWFYACIFFVPAMVLGLGALMTRRRRMGTRSGAVTDDAGNKEAQ